jgi:alanine racemase
VRAEILVFGALSVSDLDGLFDCELIPTISTPGAAQAVQAAAARYKQQLRYHLKIDTGMNRLGFRFDNLRRTLPGSSPAKTSSSKRSTRISQPPTPGVGPFEQQRVRFERVIAEVLRWRSPRYRHAANSAASCATPALVRLVRPGLLLYGIVPPPLASTLH